MNQALREQCHELAQKIVALEAGPKELEAFIVEREREYQRLWRGIMFTLAEYRLKYEVTIVLSGHSGGFSTSYLNGEVVHQGRTLKKHLTKLWGKLAELEREDS